GGDLRVFGADPRGGARRRADPHLVDLSVDCLPAVVVVSADAQPLRRDLQLPDRAGRGPGENAIDEHRLRAGDRIPRRRDVVPTPGSERRSVVVDPLRRSRAGDSELEMAEVIPLELVSTGAEEKFLDDDRERRG